MNDKRSRFEFIPGQAEPSWLRLLHLPASFREKMDWSELLPEFMRKVVVRGRVPRIMALLERLYPEGVPDWIEMKELKAQLATAEPYFAEHVPDDKTVREAKRRFNLRRRT
jgi:hypothetical protein